MMMFQVIPVLPTFFKKMPPGRTRAGVRGRGDARSRDRQALLRGDHAAGRAGRVAGRLRDGALRRPRSQAIGTDVE